MGKPTLFRGKCCNSITEQQKKSLRKACLSDDVIDSYDCSQVINTCGSSIEELLEELQFYTPGESYNPGDRVLRAEDDGYILVVYVCNSVIPEAPPVPSSGSWLKSCEVKSSLPFTELSLNEVYSDLQQYPPQGGIEQYGEYYYRAGNLVYYVEECGDLVCVYAVLQDLPTSQTPPPITSSILKKEYCISTGKNKCLGPQSEKDEGLGYESVRIGSLGHFVDRPVPYSISPKTPLLNEVVDTESPRVLSQREIDILTGVLEPECAD